MGRMEQAQVKGVKTEKSGGIHGWISNPIPNYALLEIQMKKSKTSKNFVFVVLSCKIIWVIYVTGA